jgi:hypothetical protein
MKCKNKSPQGPPAKKQTPTGLALPLPSPALALSRRGQAEAVVGVKGTAEAEAVVPPTEGSPTLHPQSPVGCRLLHFVDEWDNLTEDPYILRLIAEGIDFCSSVYPHSRAILGRLSLPRIPPDARP